MLLHCSCCASIVDDCINIQDAIELLELTHVVGGRAAAQLLCNQYVYVYTVFTVRPKVYTALRHENSGSTMCKLCFWLKLAQFQLRKQQIYQNDHMQQYCNTTLWSLWFFLAACWEGCIWELQLIFWTCINSIWLFFPQKSEHGSSLAPAALFINPPRIHKGFSSHLFVCPFPFSRIH